MLADPTAFGKIYVRFIGDLHTFDETGGCPTRAKATSGRKQGDARFLRKQRVRRKRRVHHSCQSDEVGGTRRGAPAGAKATSGRKPGAPLVRSKRVEEDHRRKLDSCLRFGSDDRGLERYYGSFHLHFITCSCYHRLPHLASPEQRDALLEDLEEVRRRYSFVVVAMR